MFVRLVRHAVFVENDDGVDRIDLSSTSTNDLFEVFTRLNLRTNYSSYAKRAVVAKKLVCLGRDLSRYIPQQRLSEEIAYATFLSRLNEDVLAYIWC